MSILAESLTSDVAKITIESKEAGEKKTQTLTLSGVNNIYKLISYIPKTKQCTGTPTRITIKF
jgi:hypothetical protein